MEVGAQIASISIMKTLAALLVLIGLVINASAQSPTKAAAAFLQSLTVDQRAKAQYNFDEPERFNWAFVPTTRNGISFHDLSSPQQKFAVDLMKMSLSEQGFKKASGVIALEGILRDVEGRQKDDPYRDPLKYFFTIFGNPSDEAPWGWRIEGHHLALNFSSINGEMVASTPSFMGANPSIVPKGKDIGKQVLKQETDLGFVLVNSLSSQQLSIARFSTIALPEIVTGNQRHADGVEQKGIFYSQLSESQKQIFNQLLNVYVKNYQFGFSKKLMDKITAAGIDNFSFAWAGALQPGDGHYYRIQGPMLLIEYDNTQGNANHVHTVVRDLTNDFAEDILREHYEKEHR